MAHPQSLVMELKGGVISTQMENSLVRVSSQRDDGGRLSWLCLPKGVESPEIKFTPAPEREGDSKRAHSVSAAISQQRTETPHSLGFIQPNLQPTAIPCPEPNVQQPKSLLHPQKSWS